MNAQWEHRFEAVPRGTTISEVLRRAGELGWEPWHIAELNIPGHDTERTIYFKRPKQAQVSLERFLQIDKGPPATP